MADRDSNSEPGLEARAQSLVAELHGHRVRTFVARDDEDRTKLSIVEHLTRGDEGPWHADALSGVASLATTPHPRLARIRGALERARGLDVVSDFIDGELLSELQTVLRAGGVPMPALCALRIVTDVLSALNALQVMSPFAQSGHGNLFPDSVVVGLDGRARLVDLVRDRSAPRLERVARFTSPELLAGRAPNHCSDLFAVGAMLADLLADADPAFAAPFLGVAKRAMAADHEVHFESAASMLSTIAGHFRDQVPTHAEVARLMTASVGERVRLRRAKLEQAPKLDAAALRVALAPGSIPVTFSAEPLPGSRRASPWPGSIPPPPRPPSEGARALSWAPHPAAAASPLPAPTRRTDPPPPGFGSAPASGMPLPLGVIPELPSSLPPGEPEPQGSHTTAPRVSSPSEPALASTAPSTAPNPIDFGPSSEGAGSWRFASAEAVTPPRSRPSLQAPRASVIIDDATVGARPPPASPPPVAASLPPEPYVAPPRASGASPPTAVDSRLGPSVPPLPLGSTGVQPKNRAPNLVLAAVATFALLGLGAGALALHRGDVAAGTKMPVAAAILAPPPPAATPARPPTERARCPEGMAFIEETTFTMGSNAADALPASKPAHAVTVSAFCIDMLEVSVAKYKACSDHGDCKRGLVTNDWPGITAAERAALEPLCNLRDPAGLADHPINCVDWERADIYCGAQGGRLPSEAEWELAASGADRRTYPWGNEVPSPSLVNACGPECAVWAANGGLEPSTPAFGATDNWLGTAPGKTFPAGATPQGVMDLAGNVSEWVADGFAPYNPTPQKDPVVSSSETRVVRGGSFVAGKRAALAATYRTREKSTRRSSSIGFRCASAPASVAGR